MLTIKAARQPHWNNAENTELNLFVTFEETESIGEMPFTASAHDVEEHGRELFKRAVAGDFGPIAAYVAPVMSQEVLRALWKQEREQQVAAIKVETSTRRVFDGNEASQDRMARAIVSLMGQPATATVLWVLADNTYAYVTAAELKEALALARYRQTELWTQS